jgi:hypothetical protein
MVRELPARHARRRVWRCIVLSGPEQQVWEDVERYWELDAEEPVQRGPRAVFQQGRRIDGVEDVPAAVVAAAWFAILLVLFGAPVAGLVVAAVTAVSWALLSPRRWPSWPEPWDDSLPDAGNEDPAGARY